MCSLTANCSHCVQDFKTETLCLVLHLTQTEWRSIHCPSTRCYTVFYDMLYAMQNCLNNYVVQGQSKKMQPRAPHLQLCSWNVDIKMNIGDDRSCAVLTWIRCDLDTVLVWDEIRRKRACSFTPCLTLDCLSRPV